MPEKTEVLKVTYSEISDAVNGMADMKNILTRLSEPGSIKADMIGNMENTGGTVVLDKILDTALVSMEILKALMKIKGFDEIVSQKPDKD